MDCRCSSLRDKISFDHRRRWASTTMSRNLVAPYLVFITLPCAIPRHAFFFFTRKFDDRGWNLRSIDHLITEAMEYRGFNARGVWDPSSARLHRARLMWLMYYLP